MPKSTSMNRSRIVVVAVDDIANTRRIVMNMFTKIYWLVRAWYVSLRIAKGILQDGITYDWDEAQAEQMYEHRLVQWTKQVNYPEELLR